MPCHAGSDARFQHAPAPDAGNELSGLLSSSHGKLQQQVQAASDLKTQLACTEALRDAAMAAAAAAQQHMQRLAEEQAATRQLVRQQEEQLAAARAAGEAAVADGEAKVRGVVFCSRCRPREAAVADGEAKVRGVVFCSCCRPREAARRMRVDASEAMQPPGVTFTPVACLQAERVSHLEEKLCAAEQQFQVGMQPAATAGAPAHHAWLG